MRGVVVLWSRGDGIVLMILMLLFGGLVALNYFDEPSRELWKGNSEPYLHAYFPSLEAKPAPSCPPAPSCAPPPPALCNCVCSP